MQVKNKLIIFDIDGTLTNTNDADSFCFEKAVLDVFPINLINNNWHHYKYSTDAGILSEIIQSKLNRDPTLIEIESTQNRFISYLETAFSENKAYCTPIEGSQTLFKNIFQCKWDIAIATGGWKKSALLKLNVAQIEYLNIPIAHSDDHFEREEIIRIAISRSKRIYNKSYYEKIIYVGDRIWDKKAAKNLGIDFIGIGEEFKPFKNDFPLIFNYNNSQLENCLALYD